MNFTNTHLLLYILLLLTACSSSSRKQENPVPVPSAGQAFIFNSRESKNLNNSEEIQAIYKMEKLFYQGDFENFFQLRDYFFKKHPQSLYEQYINLLNSRVLLQQNKIDAALEENLQVQNQSFNSNSEIYYESVFYSSEILEQKGDYDKALAALIETEKNKEKTKPRIRYFELPIKLSVSYARLNQNNLSLKYIDETESGLRKYLEIENQNKKDLAQLYYEMGASLSPSTEADYYTDARKFQLTGKYLIYCITYNDNMYSLKATKNLFEQINSLWKQAVSEGIDKNTDELPYQNKKFQRLADLSKILNSLQMLEPLQKNDGNPFQKDFFVFLDDFQNRLYDEIYFHVRNTPPTEESFRHKIYRSEKKLSNPN